MPIVMRKFQITMDDGKGGFTTEDVEGTPVQNDYEIDFFVHRTKGGGYRISELSTGMAVTAIHPLKRDAIKELNETMQKRGVDNVKEVIKKKYGQIKGEVLV
jgi:hypothetical protein